MSDHLRSLGANAPHFTADEARAASEATAILVGMAARTAAGADRGGRPAERAPLLLVIRRHIDAEIGSPLLSVSHLCHRFGISRSGLYRLFAPLGGVLEYIRRRRLARAYRDLVEAGPHGIRVSEIAYRYGYGSPVSFTQAFRAEFGLSPADVRAGGTGAGPAGAPRMRCPPAAGTISTIGCSGSTCEPGALGRPLNTLGRAPVAGGPGFARHISRLYWMDVHGAERG